MKTLLSTLALGAVLSTFGSAALAATPAAGSRDPFFSGDAVAATPGDAVIQLARQGRGRGGDSGGDSGRGRGRGGDGSSSSSSTRINRAAAPTWLFVSLPHYQYWHRGS